MDRALSSAATAFMAKLMSVPEQTDEETTKEPSEFKGAVQQHPSLLSSGTKATVQSS